MDTEFLDPELLALKEKEKRLNLFQAQFEYAAVKHFREYFYDYMLHDPDCLNDYVPKVHRNSFNHYLKKRTNSRYEYIMFTVNPKPNVTLDEFMNKIAKYHTKKWIYSYKTCIEWRKPDEGMHMHSKVQIVADKNTYNCKREVYNTFKDLVKSKLCVNARYSNRPDCFDDYIQGLKRGKPKDSHIHTIAARKKYKLKDVYEYKPTVPIFVEEQSKT